MHRPRLAPLPDRRTVNEISILDRSGDLVERHVEIPNGDPTLTSSGFVKCFPWNGGIVVAGYASNGTLGYTWLLDAEKPKEVWDFDVTKGCGYVPPDNSFALARMSMTTGW